ncbi:GIY-YIG nuclease family protein [Palleronia abyssalis]|uniref:Uncharacterized protein n=1 Tax=Palleronia abyssalis TaxID=1501240 RepID=A0A2R8C1Y3_9RHOB|nr:GIY-YIG nuclease family protein [Palleronia abyssalis]SPJ26390.1 hypothetical protein PAA8504_04248 [Palleronia abyssalis]
MCNATPHMPAAAPAFPTTIHAHWAAAARKKGFEVTRRVADRYHLMLRCAACGLEHKSRLYVLTSAQPDCPHCIEARWRDAAERAGLAWIGRDPTDRHYAYYRASCGHVLHRQFTFVDRVANGECRHRCEPCQVAREEAEAQARGWQRLGPDPAGRINHRLYRHSCGHEQAIARVNMHSGRFNCAACGTGWASAPSYIYCMRFEPEGHAPLVKLGFSRDPVSRLNHQLKRRRDLQGTILRSVPMSNGHAALCEEKRLHAHLHNAHPDAIVPRDVYRRWLRIKSEIYDAELEPVILAMLDRLTAPGSDPD